MDVIKPNKKNLFLLVSDIFGAFCAANAKPIAK